jgi:hypothetical protein
MVLRPSEQSPSERLLFDCAIVVYASSSRDDGSQNVERFSVQYAAESTI